ncbi:transcriptional regulator family: Fungal Specific TF [Penicillium argentinense]|uniref:Transcriptional regulator family: Fungal Specific TF n=1 Tax=Penicillium argentinense TaxID=1131581 RepID=A0A9W9JY45_9EURO|nr:transcriptional regulator family: Fungal Specific TF [Penicillium argentinense]KAJ5085651.1 transcriptional regulator family: Fungal Specific TF [Penicillium argentinense]
MTVTSLVMQNRRGHASGKRPLRLPIIAPKEELADSKLDKGLIAPPRIRLPPRSRTGCWYVNSPSLHGSTHADPLSRTCRSRKGTFFLLVSTVWSRPPEESKWLTQHSTVKCDEGHPQCNQCTRLGHICDYRPRLAFRDDTPRIMGRMADVKTDGNIVWDLSSPTPSEEKTDYFSCKDNLPVFAMLTSDEDRERKAEACSPGTYHVVVTPDSFTALPEYSDDAHAPESVSSVATSPISGIKSENTTISEDPNVVILKAFEDITRRSSSTGRNSRVSPTSEISDPFCALSLSPILDSLPSPVIFEDDSASFLEPCLDQPTLDPTLFAHFRHVVWKQLFPHDRSVDDSSYGHENHGMSLSVDFLAREAVRFPPLSPAIMAVSALSLSHSGTGQNVDALQYYQQAFPSLQISLRNNDDLVSDGLFLTHFLLLIYEVAAAEPHGSNLWSHHISRLLHITFLRRNRYGREPYPFIIWWICHIDLYALLSGAGTGEFLRAILDNQMLPSSDCLLYPSVAEGYSVIYSDEHDSLPTIMHLYADTFRLTAQLGFLAAQLRQDKLSLPYAEFDQRSKEIRDLRQAFARLWEAHDVAFWHQQQDSLPRRSQEMLQQSATLFHVSQLFSFSSMWPGQRLESEFSSDGDIDHHALEILHIAERTAHTRRADRHSLVFPLFLAGATAAASGLKMMAMELMTSMEDEEDGMGRNAATTRAILQTVYERQLERLMRVGHTLDVDWADLMAQEGLQMVNFGF